MEIKVIEKNELKSYLGRPVWYESLTDVNDFGWAFIHPETVKLQSGGRLLGYCRLILANPNAKDFYSWNAVQLYNKPAIRGICAHCTHFRKDQLIRCELQEQGREPECTFRKQYSDFEPAPFWKERGYTAKTFIRQLKLSGGKIKGKEKSC